MPGLQERALHVSIEVQMVMNILSIAEQRMNGRKLMVSVHDMAHTDLGSCAIAIRVSVRLCICVCVCRPSVAALCQCLAKDLMW